MLMKLSQLLVSVFAGCISYGAPQKDDHVYRRQGVHDCFGAKKDDSWNHEESCRRHETFQGRNCKNPTEFMNELYCFLKSNVFWNLLE